jgi:hypothetical protein
MNGKCDDLEPKHYLPQYVAPNASNRIVFDATGLLIGLNSEVPLHHLALFRRAFVRERERERKRKRGKKRTMFGRKSRNVRGVFTPT